MTLHSETDELLLPGFERAIVPIDDKPIQAVVGGSGPPLLMLHGDPQTHLCWHRIAPALTDSFTLVLTDLRGRGESHKPGPSPGHVAYSKRTMAAEQLQVMNRLGFETFRLVGHDRGARVARRMALDHPAAVERLAVMDIVPVLDFYERITAAAAQDYFYFFFLTQPSPVPERLIAGDPRAFMEQILVGLTNEAQVFDPRALDCYLAASANPAAVTAMCECFRAGITSDMGHDTADRDAGRKIECPTLVMWGTNGVVGRHFDVQEIWSRWVTAPAFAPMPSGHFIPEEAPTASLDALTSFLS